MPKRNDVTFPVVVPRGEKTRIAAAFAVTLSHVSAVARGDRQSSKILQALVRVADREERRARRAQHRALLSGVSGGAAGAGKPFALAEGGQ